MGVSFFQKPYQIIKDLEIKDLLTKINEQSKDIVIPDVFLRFRAFGSEGFYFRHSNSFYFW